MLCTIQKYFAMAFFVAALATCAASCATVDCSTFAETSPKRCKCIRDNGDYKRAQECSKVANKIYREKAKKDCLRTCYSLLDCERCMDL